MPGDVSFWPEARDPWEAMMAGSRAGRAKESGPPGPEIHAEERTASGDLFVVVGTAKYVLYRAGSYIRPEHWGLPTVAAVYSGGVLVPGT
jgi:hypothetical protein